MTIKDLARESGYSLGTVSRVLNGHPNVSEKARRAVMAVVEAQGFELNTNAKNLKHTECCMYRTVSNDFGPDEQFDYDMLIFFSPSGIDSLMKNFPSFEQGETVIGCFGAATAKAVRDAGLRLDLEAPSVKSPSITGALDIYLEEHQA